MSYCLVIGDGHLPEPDFIEKIWSDSSFRIACDGAGNALLNLGLHPDVIIGDMDSFNPSKLTDEHDIDIIEQRDQNTNDLEKALTYARLNKWKEVKIIGGLGKRIDHTLKNLSVLIKYNKNFEEITFEDEHGSSFILPHSWSATLPEGTIISIMPLDGLVPNIFTDGLKYPLMHEKLHFGIRDGSSNHTVKEEVSITYPNGNLLIFIGHHLPVKQ